MLSVSPTVASRLSSTKASVAKSSELVRKTETSRPARCLKRKCLTRKKLRRVAKEQHRYAKSAGLRAVAVTLTYRDSGNYSKKHISDFLSPLRKAFARKGYKLPYTWNLECAARLHYHLTLWLPRTYRLEPATLKRWWPWGSTWVEACRSVGAWGRYITKLDGIKKLPRGARSYGYGGLDEAGKTAVSRAALPRWLQAVLPSDHQARRCPGGGWVDMVTGEIYLSPYVWTPRGIVLSIDDRAVRYMSSLAI